MGPYNTGWNGELNKIIINEVPHILLYYLWSVHIIYAGVWVGSMLTFIQYLLKIIIHMCLRIYALMHCIPPPLLSRIRG
jgi:hypothetical protein